ncbi:MAG TPA: YfiR family protein [Acidobacteriaceae bacterium]|jgi:hypothetical protein
MKLSRRNYRFPANALPGVVVAVIWALLNGHNPQAEQPKPSEYQVKAAYMYNFGRFVTWPAKGVEQKSEFDICVLGPDPFGPTLDSALAGGAVGGKPVVAKRVSKPQDATDCRILYINSTESSHLPEILAALNQAPVLTVSDMPDFSRRGGIIQFVLEENKVRFEVNLKSAASAGLVLSSELLKVASSVRGNARPGGA